MQLDDCETCKLSIADYQQMRAENRPHTLLDIRTDWEREECQIESSIAVPLEEILQWAEKADKSIPVVAMCHLGIRSQHACLLLRTFGFKEVYNLQGGIDAWADQADPSMKRY